jgi:iron complex transport system substrate-binding protein
MFRSVLLIPVFFLFSCIGENSEISDSTTHRPDYAECFLIEQENKFTRIKVLNPWQKAENIRFTYILSSDPSHLPDSLKDFPVIKIPVKTVIVLSTTHIGIISALGNAFSIIGVSGKDYVSDSIVRKNIKENRCFDIGYYPNINYERILSLRPDIVFLYGLEGSVQNVAYRLKEAGIPSVLVSEYLEVHPLGKAEWIKFFAAFYDQTDIGNRIFENVQKNYTSLRDSVKNVIYKPLVLAGLPWKDTWFLPGGRSFSAQFITDAGGDYLWKDDLSKEYIALDLESVFLRALNAGTWINTGSVETKAELIGHDNRFKVIRAFRTDSVFNNNARLSSMGGNDYWESGAVYPDIILKDLIKIFHPEFLTEHELSYYRKLE